MLSLYLSQKGCTIFAQVNVYIYIWVSRDREVVCMVLVGGLMMDIGLSFAVEIQHTVLVPMF